AIRSGSDAARQTAGHNRMAVARERNPKRACARIRRNLNDILYPGASTSRQWRYAAEPAPDTVNLTTIHEQRANRPRNGARNPRPVCLIEALFAERIGQLSDDLAGERGLIVHAILVRQRAFRHPEGPEQDVPERKGAREIGVAALLAGGVVPAVKHRRRQDVFERAERPVEVG